MTDVFISYSRKDSDFAKKLVNRLAQEGRDVWIDWEDIPRAADWLNEIYAGIEAADAFVFIVSQHSLTSEICNYEVAHALKNNKRVVPLILQEIMGDVETFVKGTWYGKEWQQVADNNWTALSHLNWIFFHDTARFDNEYKALVHTIEQDPAHVKQHTRYLVRAREWEIAGKNPSYLLIGDEIANAETWYDQANSEQKQPPTNALQHSYISASRKAESERIAHEQYLARRARNAIIVVLMVIVIAATSLAVIFARDNAELQLEADSLRATMDFSLAQAATAQFHADYVQAQSVWINSRVLGNGGLPGVQLTQTPVLEFLATATRIAELGDWEVQIQEFDGVEMVLVPYGCFWMGSLNGFEEERSPSGDLHEICFEEPFWIDRYEVTNAQFDKFGGTAANEPIWATGNDQPRTMVTWFEAQTFCEINRNAYLPTEAQWEYAARGPNSLVYPWGNTYDEENIISGRNAAEPDVVGSRAGGISWVGAYDMIGNTVEWVSTIYDTEAFPYPYADDERENLEAEDVQRVVRGGLSFYDYDFFFSRAAFRDQGAPDQALEFYGWRCAKLYET